jgi:hypothetical protein
MNFYANGKLVCLEKINNKKSALWGGFKRNMLSPILKQNR